MIGSVTLDIDGTIATATLAAGGAWSFEGDPVLVDHLKSCTDLVDFSGYSPADGAFGCAELHALAKRTGGTLKLTEYPPMPPGTIY